MKQMVNFPSPVGSYRDSGEGGLFVMMAVPEPEDFSHNCHVDGIIEASRPGRKSKIQVSSVDVEVTRSRIWDPWDFDSPDHRRRREVEKILEKDHRDLWMWSTRMTLPEDHSDSLLFAAHMGSTGESLWDVDRSEYFTATRNDLTYEGRALYEAVKAAYSAEPMLITCLDT